MKKLRVDTGKPKAAPLPKRARVGTPKMPGRIWPSYLQVKKQDDSALRNLADT